MNSRKSALARWARIARRAGWSVELTAGHHLRWASPSGAVVITASTPGRGRALINTRADLRRAGLEI